MKTVLVAVMALILREYRIHTERSQWPLSPTCPKTTAVKPQRY